MPRERILVVDDEPGSIEAFRALLKDSYDVLTATSGEEALKLTDKETIHLVLLDIIMPGMDGLEVLKRIKEQHSHIIVVMVTATKSIKNAVEAMRHGAFDYVTKPFDISEVKLIIQKALQNRILMNELNYLREELKQRYGLENIIGKSAVIRKVFEMIQKVAAGKATVLLTGESGTGKELVARAIHFKGSRAENPFVAVQCAAIPENLLESELFGHEKGAFTDAVARKLGKFELAHTGTLFLDEIGEMDLNLQAKILRAIEEQEIVRVGGTQAINVDVRIIAATNKDLKQAVKNKAFREDLYYRINVVPVHLPTLRERKEDIPLLINYFLKKYAPQINPKIEEISPEAIKLLEDYSWPGNVRELENIVERILTLSSNRVISADDLPLEFRQKQRIEAAPGLAAQKLPLAEAVAQFEKERVIEALKASGGVVSKAARQLGITRRILKYKMDNLGIKE